MKKLLPLIFPALLLTTSCVDTLDSYNVNPKAASVVPGPTLVSNAERNLFRTVTSSSVNLNPYRLWVQYWGETTYYDESRYDYITRSINRFFWDGLYRDVLRDLEEGKRLITADASLDTKVQANQLAQIEVLQVYTWYILVNTYGNIPYTESLNFTNSQPKYDDAATIYTDIAARLDKAIAQLTDGGSLDDADLIYGGDVTEWKKFANSLKLRMALTLADVDAAKAQTMATEAAPNVFASDDDDATLDFLSAPPNTNPLWEDLVQSGRKDFVGTSFFIGKLKTLNDPRLTSFFKPVSGTTDTYTGGKAGESNSVTLFSPPGAKLEDPSLPGVLLSYSEVEFLLAEAAARGFGVTGTAASHYEAGIKASLTKWGSSDADVTTYLAQPTVAYANAASGATYKEKIGNQKWIALYLQPVESYKEVRRLDAPTIVDPAQALSAFPLRYTYPATEQNINTANYNEAATAIGGDKVTTKLFWDKF